MQRIFSFKALPNGTYGEAFAIGAARYDVNGNEVDKFLGRCPVTGVASKYVSTAVLPSIESIEVTHSSYEELLEEFIRFYQFHKGDSDVIITHNGVPSEAKLFIDAHRLGYIDDFGGPFPLVDIASYVDIGTSMNIYALRNDVDTITSGSPHDPLTQARNIASVYMHYTGGNDPNEESPEEWFRRYSACKGFVNESDVLHFRDEVADMCLDNSIQDPWKRAYKALN